MPMSEAHCQLHASSSLRSTLSDFHPNPLLFPTEISLDSFIVWFLAFDLSLDMGASSDILSGVASESF